MSSKDKPSPTSDTSEPGNAAHRFHLGQRVYLLHDNAPLRAEVVKVSISIVLPERYWEDPTPPNTVYVRYTIGLADENLEVREDALAATKEELAKKLLESLD